MVMFVSSSEIYKNSRFVICTIATIYRLALFQKNSNLPRVYKVNRTKTTFRI